MASLMVCTLLLLVFMPMLGLFSLVLARALLISPSPTGVSIVEITPNSQKCRRKTPL